MIRMTSPGLPMWPPLLFDPKKRRSVVRARFASWKAHERGIQVTEVISLIVLFAMLVVCWKLVAPFYKNHWRLLFTFGLWFLIGFPAAKWMRWEMPGMLARQFFASTLKVWFTEDAIAIESSLYERPVILPRRWKTRSVNVDFSVDDDQSAKSFLCNLRPERKASKSHLESSRRVTLIVNGGSVSGSMPTSADSIMQAFPICELSAPEADRVSVVCMAAKALTERRHEPSPFRPERGIDIDAE